MEVKYVDLPLDTYKVAANDLTISKAIDFYTTIENAEGSVAIECEAIGEVAEIITFDIDIPLGQRPINDILFCERLLVIFSKDDNHIPLVYALREDFPKLLHLNLTDFEKPRSLCIYEKDYDELKIDWRSSQFLEDIRNWLTLSAYNKLHQEDQPLEPFLIDIEGTIVLPPDLMDNENLHVYLNYQYKNVMGLIGSRQLLNVPNLTVLDYISIFLSGEPRVHGVLDVTPRSLFDLKELLTKVNISFDKILNAIKNNKISKEHKFMVIASFPKKSTIDTQIAGVDYYCFMTEDSIGQIGLKLEMWVENNGELIDILFQEPKLEKLKEIKIGILQPHLRYSKQQAVKFNAGTSVQEEVKIAQIGVGALGSNIFMNLSRMGLGKWNLYDYDLLLPHNLARHSLHSRHIGMSKSIAVSNEANFLLGDSSHSTGHCENILKPEDKDGVIKIICKQEVILDFSTSIAVQRELTDSKYGNGQRICAFLNPSGSDLVVLSESMSRDIKLDVLEFQFYRELTHSSSIHDHVFTKESKVRYSNSCRDVSSRIPNTFINIHGSIATNHLINVLHSENTSMNLWRINETNSSVQNHEFTAYGSHRYVYEDWEIILDDYIIDLLMNARIEKLPNETGGILIGGYDMLRKKIYVVDSILSPNDSHEYPYAYIRGINEVEDKLKYIDRVTNGNLKYIGEWHSHPPNAKLDPSEDDKELFEWLSNEMKKINQPPLMMIVGANKKINIITENI